MTGVVLFLALVAAGCGGGGSSSSSTTPPTSSSVTVTISPTTATVGYGSTQQFTATVAGSTNTTVDWTVTSSSSSSSTEIGTIDSSSGLYTAPSATSVPAAPPPSSITVTAGNTIPNVDISVPPLNSITSVTVTATSQADPSQSASATVTLSGVSIQGVGQCVQSTTSSNTLNCSGDATGTSVSPGQTVFLFVVGPGILPGTTYAISGNGVTVTQPASGNFQTAPDGTPVVYFSITVSSTATPGPRNLVVTNSGNELASFPGALAITQ